jgi:hypothetical protein
LASIAAEREGRSQERGKDKSSTESNENLKVKGQQRRRCKNVLEVETSKHCADKEK